MSTIRTAAVIALLAVPAHGGGYVSPVPFGPPIMSVEALFPTPTVAAPPRAEWIMAGIGIALLLFLLSRDKDGDGGSYVAPLPGPTPQPAPVPVPPAAPMLLAGVGMLAIIRRAKR